MKLELNVKHFNNEDVIATSGLTCADVYGVAKIFYTGSQYQKNVYENDDSSLKYGTGTINQPDGFIDDGWYHVDVYGNIIEKCPHSSSEIEVKTAHNIDQGY